MSASVKSFDAIQRIREELLKFAQSSGLGLDELEAEIRRTIEWVEHDRPQYWRMRVHRAHDAVTEAKNALHRCLMYPINDEQPSCTEERAALAKAEAELERCRKKHESVSEWSRTLRHELHEYKGRTTMLRQVIDADLPSATTALGQALLSLEKYATGVYSAGTHAASGAEEAETPAVSSSEQKQDRAKDQAKEQDS